MFTRKVIMKMEDFTLVFVHITPLNVFLLFVEFILLSRDLTGAYEQDTSFNYNKRIFDKF